MHGLNLSVDSHVCGNVLWDLCVENAGAVGQHDSYLEGIWEEFNIWCKARKISCSQKRFSLVTINMKKANKYPLLAGKAANTRTVLAFLAEKYVAVSEVLNIKCAYPWDCCLP
jgi:hypothetical protein